MKVYVNSYLNQGLDSRRIGGAIGAILPSDGALRRLAATSGIFVTLLVAVFAPRADAQTCSFTVAPSAVFLDASAQKASVTVTASAAGCAWTESTAENFIAAAAGSAGSGPASFNVSVNATATDRVGSLIVAGQTVSVTQRFTTTPFGDIDPSDFYFDAVNLLKIQAVTDGCEASPLLFCPDDIVTRDQMAVFLVRALYGGDNFAASTTPYFTDVQPSSFGFLWIQKLHELGITKGCTETTYCPNDAVTRDDMALFLIRLRYGLTIAGKPPTFNYPVTPYFSDVLAVDPDFPWVQRLKQDGITSGCTITTYCPDLQVSRGEMAVFLMRAALNQLLTGPTPLVTQIIPSTLTAGSTGTFTVTGTNTNFVQGTTVLASIPGVTIGPITVNNATTLTVQLTTAADAPTEPDPIVAITGGEQAALPDGFTVIPSGLTITSISPASAAPGALVTVVGTNFVPAAAVTLSQQGGGTVPASVVSVNPGSLSFVVPANAATGPVSVSGNSQTAVSQTPLTITGSAIFTLSVAPGVVNVIQGQSASLAIQVASSTSFNSPATLSLAGLPQGITASINPPVVAAGQTAVATFTAASAQALSTSNITVTAAAVANSVPISQSATAQLAVIAPTTSFLGRTVVSNAQETPLAGVVVSMLGLDGGGNSTGCTGTAISDGAGNFALTNLAADCIGPQLVGFGGNNVTSPAGKYAGVNLVFTLVGGKVVVSPVLVHLPRVDNVETFSVQQNSATDQSYSFASVPGVSVTVYAHTIFTESDGSQPNPFPLAAIEVPVDRLPDVMPATSASVTAFIVAFQPANTVASQPVAVSFPNSLNTPPGTEMPLMTLNPTLGRMVPYGTGTVSNDGTTIIPNIDPTTGVLGHRFGIVHFDWHGPTAPAPPTIHSGPPDSGPSPCTPGAVPAAASGPGDCGTTSCPCNAASTPTSNGPTSLMELPDSAPDWATEPRNILARGQNLSVPEKGVLAEPGALAGDPVDLSSGVLVINNTDLSFSGSRGSLALVRNYHSLSTNGGPFGIGTGHNYSLQLDISGLVRSGQGQINLVMPDGNQFPFYRTATGTFVNTSIPAFAGAVFTNSSSGVFNLRYRNGVTWGFQESGLEAFLTSITDSNGNATVITLDPSQPLEVTQVTDPVGRSLTFTYDGASRITSVTDPIGRTTQYSYNTQGTLATFTDAAGGVTSYAYDANNNMIQMTDPRGIVQMQNTLDPTGRVIKQVRPDGGVLTFVYAAVNPLVPSSPLVTTQITDSNGVQATYRFNPAGFVTGVTSTLGQTSQIVLQAGTNLRSGAVFASAATTYTYDSNGNALTSTDPTGRTTTFTYDPVFSRVTSVTDGLGKTSLFQYDAKGNLMSSRDANGSSSSYQYDSTGLLTRWTDALNRTTKFAYDSVGNLIAVTDPAGNSMSFTYDPISRMTQTTDALGRKTYFAYDALSRLSTQTDAKAGTTTRTYDQNGNVLSIKDARGNTNAFAYDSMNRLLSRTDPLGKSDTRVWDTNANLTQYVDRRGRASSFSYDNLNRLVKETYSDATVIRTYDFYGRLSQVNDSASGLFTFTHDLASRVLNTSTPYGSVSYTYDGRGAMTSRQVAGQPTLSYSYDAAGNLTGASMPQAAATFAYDARNEITTISRANGIASTFSYDPDARLTSIVHARGSGAIDTESYGYDAVSNRNSHSTNIGQVLATPATTNTYNAANQLAQFGAVANAFDGNGNLAQQAGAATYTWDGRGRLSSIVTPTGQTTDFAYDFAGNLLAQADSGPNVNLVRTFVLDDLTNIAYETASDGSSYSVLAGRGIDSHLAISQSNGQVQYGLADGINSTMATVDQNGAVVSRFQYEPFGQTTGAGAYPFQFTGRQPISNSTYYSRARFYSGQTGRFISEDPIGFAGGDANLYRYVGNNPSGSIDPVGLTGLFGQLSNWADQQASQLADNGYYWLAGAEYLAADLIRVNPLLDAIDTLTDPCKPGWQKGIAAGSLAFGALGAYAETGPTKLFYAPVRGWGWSRSTMAQAAWGLYYGVKWGNDFNDIKDVFVTGSSALNPEGGCGCK